MINVSFESPNFKKDGALVLGLTTGGTPAGLGVTLAGLVSGVMAKGFFKPEKGSTCTLYDDDGRPVVLMGLGEGKLAEAEALKLGGTMMASLEATKAQSAHVILCDNDGALLQHTATGAALRAWRFEEYKAKKSFGLESISFGCTDPSAADKAFKNGGGALADGVLWARRLVNMPANDLTPTAMMKEMKACESLGLKVSCLDEKQMREMGMGALLGVAMGSDTPPFLGIMEWKGGAANEAPVAFVGKGVTFDTGGISLKPSNNMHEMKGDMGGSAVVLGTMRALAQMKAKVNAVAVVALVENMPSGRAQRPGDIVRSLSGHTIEVLNTDAEGRLILADALTYAERTFKPKAIIDVATLTGAMIHALGPVYAGLFSDNKGLEKALFESGQKTGERVWAMPLDQAFEDAMKGSVSDLQNIAPPGFGAGSCTAAQFLRCFVDKTPWAHLDIASVDNLRKDTPLTTRGGSAYGVRLLCNWVQNGCPL